MEAKDTVMNKRDITAAILADEAKHGATHSPKYFSENITELKSTAKAQAEVSFKAGIREVVEWIRQQPTMGTGVYIVGVDAEQIYGWKVLIGKLQAKLKEWGLEQ